MRSSTPLSPEEIGSEVEPRPGVKIVRDAAHHVPRIYAGSRCDAMFGIGFARAQDRLWQMDVNRHTHRAARAAFLGAGAENANLTQDAVTFSRVDYSEEELGEMYRNLGTRYGKWGRAAQQDLRCYVSGINELISVTRRDPARLPIEYRQRGRVPEIWRVTDEIVTAAYAHKIYEGAGTGGAGNARLLSQLRARLGETAGREVFDDLRNADDPETPVVVDTPYRVSRARPEPRATAIPDPNSYHTREVLVEPRIAVPVAAALGAFRGFNPSKSNALLVGGAATRSGRPIAVQGPQDQYGMPHAVDSEVQVSAPDLEFRGILEFFGPYPYDGARGKSFAFSGTVQFNSQIDTFVERLCKDASGRLQLYSYGGRCVKLIAREVSRKIAGTDATYTLRSLRSVHGPIVGYATVNGEAVAVAEANATAFHEEADFVQFAQLFTASEVQGPRTDYCGRALRRRLVLHRS